MAARLLDSGIAILKAAARIAPWLVEDRGVKIEKR